jgi:glycosyltransferase involved in cell wall biosynthesis
MTFGCSGRFLATQKLFGCWQRLADTPPRASCFVNEIASVSMSQARPVPKITIGIPFHNEQRCLLDAVRSVLRQTVVDWELLLVDDGSTDDSLALARTIEDPRVKIVSDGVRRRLPARLNEIARLARAPLVARMDADDVAHPRRLEAQLAVFETLGNAVDVVGTWAGLITDDGVPFAVVEALPEPPTRRQALDRGLVPHATMMARRDWLLCHPYDESYARAEDRELFVRTVSSSSYVAVPEVLYAVRISSRRADFVDDYRASQRQGRRLMLREGPAIYGHAFTRYRWLASWAKEFVARAAVGAGAGEWLVRRRGRPMTDAERATIIEAVEAGRRVAER